MTRPAALTARSAARPDAGRFTLVELLVVVTIIATVAAVTMAAVSSGLRQARQTQCLSNLRQLGQAVHLYASENGDQLPACARLGPDLVFHLPSLRQSLAAHLPDERLYHCPADQGAGSLFADTGTSYEWNTLLSGRTLDRTTLTVAGLKLAAPLAADGEDFHGARGRNYLFPDGHTVTSREPPLE